MKNDYQQSKCENVSLSIYNTDQPSHYQIIDQLYICCGNHYKNTQEKIDSCPIESVLDRKLKDRGLADKI